MNVTQIEETVKKLASDVLTGSVEKDQFIYELMTAYGHRKTTVSRIKSGERNLAKVAGEVRAKRHIYFKHSDSNEVFSDIDDMKKEPSITREKIRFIIATDFNQFVAVDTRTHDTLDIEFGELGKHFDFFLPWAGMEKAVYQGDNPADVKAAEKMAKLFDLIKADNFSEKNKNDNAALHSLNVFLTRLLFCFFAEDTGIFKDNQFSAELESHTKADGSDVDSYLNRLFEVLNTSKENRHDLPDYLAKFEYVNGGLFADPIASPKFSTKSRRMLIECGSELDWSGINPDIFGSMIQAVAHPEKRDDMGMHYTSVINIMKVIEPLFLDDLYKELENILENIDPKLRPSRLRKLHDRIANIKIFDPACGSGNFLIIAFKELRKFEMEVIKNRQELERNSVQDDFFDEISLDSSFSRIKLSQFYGIELDDFAHEVAILSLWLAEHQMNIEFKVEFGECEPSLPLKERGQIICGNAVSLNWQEVCDNTESVTFVIGNPPYLGQPKQKAAHIKDMDTCFSGLKDYKKLDYVSCWFYRAAVYLSTGDKAAFVSTNSINQGMQVSMLWPKVFSHNIEIIFAHRNFKWSNSAKNNAQVTCSIIGFAQIGTKINKYIFENNLKLKAKTINAYLVDGGDVIVSRHLKSISNLPKILGGNQAREGGHLFLTNDEKIALENSYPEVIPLIKKVMGTAEFTKGISRWCLWIDLENLSLARSIPPVIERIKKVRVLRESGNTVEINFKNVPHQFVMTKRAKFSQIIIPEVSSEKRLYIPSSFIDIDTVVTHKAQVIYDSEPYIFSLISCSLHMLWVRAVGGRLGTGFSYSVGICYNTFPCPVLTDEEKKNMTNLGVNIMIAREKHYDKTITELYEPDKMPKDLLEAHKENDAYILKLYGLSADVPELTQLNKLFSMYSNMTGNNNA